MKTILKKYVVKTWDDLTEEEKEAEKEKYCEQISICWDDLCYENFKNELEEIKERYKNIKFDDVLLDYNSQVGFRIDSIENFNYYGEEISIYGEDISLYDIDIKICRTINSITSDDIIIEDYYIDSEKLEKIKATKKYEKWVNEIVKDVNNWIDEINEVCENYMNNYNYVPDDFVEDYFINNNIEFEYYIDTIKENNEIIERIINESEEDK